MLKVPYDSSLAIVKNCLAQKQWLARHEKGIGPHSCCAMIEVAREGTAFFLFGNSQFKAPVDVDIYKNKWIKCHGESNAVTGALHLVKEKEDLSAIKRVYIELSPCVRRCQALLNNVNPNMEILYSFDHPAEIKAWKTAAANLCKAKTADVDIF